MSPAVVTAALTGPIATKADNPNLPTSPAEIAEAARGAYEAGAAVVHLHLRDADGNPTADLDVAKRVVDAVGEACPALIQLSTGVGLTVPFEERERLVEARPRMASLNPCSMSFGARRVPQSASWCAAPCRADAAARGQAGARDLRHGSP